LQDGDLLMGAPGSWAWRGNIFKNSIQEGFTADKKTYRSPVTNMEQVPPPEQQPVGDYYSYQGKLWPRKLLLVPG